VKCSRSITSTVKRGQTASTRLLASPNRRVQIQSSHEGITTRTNSGSTDINATTTVKSCICSRPHTVHRGRAGNGTTKKSSGDIGSLKTDTKLNNEVFWECIWLWVYTRDMGCSFVLSLVGKFGVSDCDLLFIWDTSFLVLCYTNSSQFIAHAVHFLVDLNIHSQVHYREKE
jgi:hypothetical protein